ncbi:serine/threonine-protein kinase [Streptomyces sp. AJS327]|uniref:serine/threonine-protein kinase n=1 Tax=Streptomyces sp. AJS327 TaxID=2545265 RepID=UPI002155A6C6|nr:serine/threonine-protein kinase [Streptomyces sp. AJS327]
MEELAPDEPREIAGYQLKARLGQGGMGMVYLSHTRGGQPVALKVVRREYAQDPEFRRRFAAEVAAARRVQGPYTAPVLDSFTDGPEPWLATAYVPGPSLSSAVNEHGPLPLGTVLQLTAGVAEALQTVHAANVVHRDLKPSNVLLASDGPRVIDFGIARAADATALTGTDARLGTPAFMAPEQAVGGEVTPALDVFALGLVAHFAATHRHPHGDGASAALLFRIVSEEPDLSECPEELRELISSCLAKDPADRPTPARVIERCALLAGTAGVARDQDWWLPPTLAAEVSRQEQTLRLVGSGDGTGATPQAAPPAPAPPGHSPQQAMASAAPTAPGWTPHAQVPHAPTAPHVPDPRPAQSPPGFGAAPLPPDSGKGGRRTSMLVAASVAGALVLGAGTVLGIQMLSGDGDDSGGNGGGQAAESPSGRGSSDDRESEEPPGGDPGGGTDDTTAPPEDTGGDAKQEAGWRLTQQDKSVTLSGPKPDTTKRYKVCDTYYLDVDNDLSTEHPGNVGLIDSFGAIAYGACAEPDQDEGFQTTDGAIMNTTKKEFPKPSECLKIARDSSLPNPVPLKKVRDDSVFKENTGICVESSEKAVAHLWIRKINRDGKNSLPSYVLTATLWEPES